MVTALWITPGLGAVPVSAQEAGSVPPIPLLAQRGAATAYAAPPRGITVDGRLEDWPETMVRYFVLNNRVPGEPYGPNGLTGADLTTSLNLSPYFMASYDADAGLIHVAVVVRDDKLIVGFTSPWDTDAVEIYVDGTHAERRYEGPDPPTDAGLLPALQYFGVPGRGPAYGDINNSGGHNPAMAYGPIEKTKTRMAYSRSGDVTVYEWAIQAFDHFPDAPTKLVPGKRLGFDVVVVDLDSAGGKPAWICWGPMGPLKFFDSSLLGDLILGSDP